MIKEAYKSDRQIAERSVGLDQQISDPVRRFYNLDLLKSFAILFVVSYHLCYLPIDFLSTNSIGAYVMYFMHSILATSVPLFFFVNGFLLFGKPLNLKKHVQRTAKYVLLVFVWGAALLGINLLLTPNLNLEFYQILDAFLCLSEDREIDILWYLGALVCIYILFPALKALYDSDNKAFILLTATLAVLTIGHGFMNDCLVFLRKLIVSVFGVEYPAYNLNHSVFLNFNPFRGMYGYTIVYFCLGGLVYRYSDYIAAFPVKRRNLIAGVAVLVSCACLFLQGVFLSKYIDRAKWDIVWYGLDKVFTLINVCALYVLSLNYKRQNSLIQYVSRNTLGIYLLHFVIARAFQPVFDSLSGVVSYVPYNLYLFVIIGLCLLVTAILKKIPVLRNLI